MKEGNNEVKLNFKERQEVVKSDNPEYKFYPIKFNLKDLERKNKGREMQIVFKLDNGSVLTLPFNAIKFSELAIRN